jgi:hypothetical protein
MQTTTAAAYDLRLLIAGSLLTAATAGVAGTPGERETMKGLTVRKVFLLAR